MTSKTDGFSVADGMWTTTQQTWHPLIIIFTTIFTITPHICFFFF